MYEKDVVWFQTLIETYHVSPARSW